MKITVTIPGPLRTLVDAPPTLVVQARTVADVLIEIDKRFPGLRTYVLDEHDDLRPHVKIFVNETAARRTSVEVSDGDTVHIFPAVSGG